MGSVTPVISKMTRFTFHLLLAGCVAVSTSVGAPAPAQPVLGRVPLFFAEQPAVDGLPQFLASGGASQVLISPDAIHLTLRNHQSVSAQMVGASPQARLHGAAELAGKVNYLQGNRAAFWRTGVPMYGQVRVENLYPGISAIYYGNQERLEYDFAVAPGTSPSVIQMRFAGADKISLDAQGDLALAVGPGEIRQPKPVIYQMLAGARQSIAGGYRLVDARTVAFTIGEYDHTQPLIIDPILNYSTYFGGSSGDAAWAVAVNPNDGSIFVAGATLSPKLATTNAWQTTFHGGTYLGDAFVAKFDPNFNVQYLTYLGGSGEDTALALAVNKAGNAFVAGYTDSTDFPVTNSVLGLPGVPGITNHISGSRLPGLNSYLVDGFVAELATNGANLIYSTYLGGNLSDAVLALALDSSDNVYLTGYTQSTNLPAKNALRFQLASQPGGQTNQYLNYLACPYTYSTCNAFIARISHGGTNLDYLTYFGGGNFDVGTGIAVDAAGNVYVTGYTASTNFPNLNAFQTNLNQSSIPTGGFDAYVAKLAPTNTGGLNLLYSTFLGSTYSDAAQHLAVDNTGVYVTGWTTSPGFPNTATNIIANGMANNINGLIYTTNAFLAKIITTNAQNASSLAYSAVFGGLLLDSAAGVALDPAGNAFVVGSTCSPTFPTTNAFGWLKAVNIGDNGVFITAFNTNATQLLYSVILSGTLNDFGNAIAVDQNSSAYVVGQTYSGNFPVTTAVTNFPVTTAQTSTLNGASDAFLSKIQLNFPRNLDINAFRKTNTVALSWPYSPVIDPAMAQYVLQGKLNLLTTNWVNLTNGLTLTNSIYSISLPATNAYQFFRLHNTNNPN